MLCVFRRLKRLVDFRYARGRVGHIDGVIGDRHTGLLCVLTARVEPIFERFEARS